MRTGPAFDAPHTFSTLSNRPLSIRLKSSTSFSTLDIMLRLPSSALNSISCAFATVPEASMFCTASSAVLSGTRTSWKT